MLYNSNPLKKKKINFIIYKKNKLKLAIITSKIRY